ncbi:unnamed protein product [Clonostachys rosea]|uniref:C3H1-type domain-containing protein n=1 Tax=Bionectria ochroleuca TaxID=29856 RepID=A0ABY6UDR4_BIOOC|nr:unnamed protein product [Clonostachys rosea]
MSRLRLDLSDQTDSRIRYQEEVQTLRKELANYKNMLDKNTYVAVLVDGDGAVFNESLLQNPVHGATEASQKIKQCIQDDLRSSGENDQLPIFARVFANLHHLAGAIKRSGLIDDEEKLIRFSENFTNSCAEFDFINVGRGKENADCKMRRMLKYYYNDYRCKKIYFVGCHDGGYSHDLREYIGPIHKPENRIVLVETTPALPLIKSLSFPMLRFDSVFRSEPLPDPSFHAPSTNQPPPAVAKPVLPPAPQRNPSPEAVAAVRSPSVTTASLPSPAPTPTVDVKRSGNGGISVKYPPSYASAGGKDGLQNLDLKPAAKAKKPKVINLNKDGQRVDPPVPFASPQAQNSYNAKWEKNSYRAFCNAHYLGGNCPWGDRCDREHTIKLTASEVSYHRSKARGSACNNGSRCADFNCYLSHHCPQSPSCVRRDCKFKNHNRHGDMHLDKESMQIV